jgi:hypothetical protein
MNACLSAMTLGLDTCTVTTPDSLNLECLLKTAVKFQQCFQAEDRERSKLDDALNKLDAQLEELIADIK